MSIIKSKETGGSIDYIKIVDPVSCLLYLWYPLLLLPTDAYKIDINVTLYVFCLSVFVSSLEVPGLFIVHSGSDFFFLD